MPIEASPTNDARVIISQSHGQPQTDGRGWQKWLPYAAFVGLSAFVLSAELLDLVEIIKGNLAIVKMILAALVGVGAGFATSHSSLLIKRKRE